MRQRLIAQIVKELLLVLRDPRSRMVLIGPPLAQLFIFAFAATLEVKSVAVAVLDEDAGSWSQELVHRVAATDLVRELVPVSSGAALRAAIEERRALLGLRLPQDFSRLIEAGGTGTAQVIVDGRSANAGQIALGYLETIVAGLGHDVVLELHRGNPPRPGAAVTVQLRHWFNPNLEYIWFTVPSLVGILSMFSALLVTALSIARERELGTFDQLRVSPAGATEIIVAKSVPALIIGTALGTVMLMAGIWIFRIPFTGSLALLYGGLLLFMLSAVGVGLVLSSVSRTQQQAILGTFALGVPLVLLSGFATPVENMPTALQWAAELNPLKHFLVIVQGSFLKDLPATAVAASAWPMAAIAAVTLSAAVVAVRVRLD